ncbi:Metallo-dependent phosphatase [Gonapodya prolifera JEL478]|uniref:Metallo-dependent phosphatase n=1 Tax=Gonapodya prolifera (strain JEL478) TaxID=1344416 RepID=A0A138ZYT5_GONPJ|nr:Metallo-dependent phosphatase [Gonapodya prolifera JEL478]|eukprot:KXS09578.1 Metallo-dependent phosphatase [Gonapodya prolifera JEL478]
MDERNESSQNRGEPRVSSSLPSYVTATVILSAAWAVLYGSWNGNSGEVNFGEVRYPNGWEAWGTINDTRRVVVIGDVHGDFPNLFETLRVMDLITIATQRTHFQQGWVSEFVGTGDDKDSEDSLYSNLVPHIKWTGRNTVFVQVGDWTDRGPHVHAISLLIRHIQRECLNCRFLLGNHETMNLVGDLRYVSKEEIAGWGNKEVRRKEWEDGARGSVGWWVRRNNPLAVQVGDLVVVHAGITPEFSQRGLLRLNADFLAVLKPYPLNNITESLKPLARHEVLSHPIFAGEGPQWSRLYARPQNFLPSDPSDTACAPLMTALSHFGATMQVIGHTPQFQRRARSRCGGRVILGDIGISRAYGGGGRIGAVEIELSNPQASEDIFSSIDSCGGPGTVKDPQVCPGYFQMWPKARVRRVRGVYGHYAEGSTDIIVEGESLVKNAGFAPHL